MKHAEFERKVKQLFGVDFTKWYCQVFLKKTDSETLNRIRKLKPMAYRELIKFLMPFIEKGAS